MGLDVYLTRSDDIDAHLAWEKRRDDVPYDDSYSDRMAKWDAENPDPAPDEEIRRDSAVYPEHMFKIGYLRSSYNAAGIEIVVGNAIGKGLHDIFDVSRDEYIVRPEWPQCLRRAIEVRDEYARHIAEHGSYRVEEVSLPFGILEGVNVTSSKDALARFREERADYRKREKHPMFGGSYSGRDGHFYLDEPLRVAGIIHGTDSLSGFMGRKVPAAYVIYEHDASWYQQALCIIVEMCEWVIAQKDPQTFYLRWSG